MRPFFALSLALLLISFCAQADTHVPAGPVSGIWNAFYSPYLIEGNINIPAGDTLTMMPGTVVNFQSGYYYMNVYGILNVNGQPGGSNERVNIQGIAASSVSQIYFYSTVGSSHLQYATITTVVLCLFGQAAITIDHCNLSREIFGWEHTTCQKTITNSNLNSLNNGSNWTVTDNILTLVSSVSAPGWYISSESIGAAQGYFARNTLNISIINSSPEGEAGAQGIMNCTGTFEYNTINVYAYGGGGSDGHGVLQSTGICRYNSIKTTAGLSYGILNFSGNLYNCTVLNSDYGIYSTATATIHNCIVNNCETGFYGPVQVLYSDVYGCQTPFAGGATTGIGTIQQDPLLVNEFFLAPNSPCIDTGDPASPLDPDFTRADMGAHYFNQTLPLLDITLIPINPPILIPANGGSFNFRISAIRNVGPQAPYTVWARIKNPDGSYTNPTLGPVTINTPVGVTITRQRTQTVPGTWAAGLYTYLGYVNTTFVYPAIDSSSFTFTKSATSDGGPWVTEASCTGEVFPGEEAVSLQPTAFGLLSASPNPFNSSTALSFKLQASSRVSLKVYDTVGRLVETLVDGWREVGTHEITFDGSTLASGMYFVKLQVGGRNLTSKILLLK